MDTGEPLVNEFFGFCGSKRQTNSVGLAVLVMSLSLFIAVRPDLKMHDHLICDCQVSAIDSVSKTSFIMKQKPDFKQIETCYAE